MAQRVSFDELVAQRVSEMECILLSLGKLLASIPRVHRHSREKWLQEYDKYVSCILHNLFVGHNPTDPRSLVCNAVVNVCEPIVRELILTAKNEQRKLRLNELRWQIMNLLLGNTTPSRHHRVDSIDELLEYSTEFIVIRTDDE
ncbi:MAG: hypothetical protein Q8Q18_03885 [bacterium]|nr:hypothetical protein [bacterium]